MLEPVLVAQDRGPQTCLRSGMWLPTIAPKVYPIDLSHPARENQPVARRSFTGYGLIAAGALAWLTVLVAMAIGSVRPDG